MFPGHIYSFPVLIHIKPSPIFFKHEKYFMTALIILFFIKAIFEAFLKLKIKFRRNDPIKIVIKQESIPKSQPESVSESISKNVSKNVTKNVTKHDIGIQCDIKQYNTGKWNFVPNQETLISVHSQIRMNQLLFSFDLY